MIGRGMRSTRVFSVIICSVILRSVMPTVLAAAGGGAALAAAPLAQHVVVEVNGRAVTDDDIDQCMKFNRVVNRASPLRKQILEELIDDRLKAGILSRFRLDLSAKDIDSEFADMAKRLHMSPDQLTHALSQARVDIKTVRAKLLLDISWRIVLRGYYVVRGDVRALFDGRSGDMEHAGIDYTLRPILFLAPRDDAPLLEARRKDADALRARFAGCDAGLADARTLHDVIIRPPVTKNSSDFPPSLREILNRTEVGHLTPPETTAHGIELFAVCNKKKITSGNKASADTPEARAAREKLFADRFDVLSKTCLRELRRRSTITFMR
jgi:peptidyl-prolyl cis-trans isomerase SurA